MKITNINYSDESSGSQIAVSRINDMLKMQNIESNILTFKSFNQNINYGFWRKFDENMRFYFKKILKKILHKLCSVSFAYTINFGIIPSFFLRKINECGSDIINLHWIGNEILSINQVAKIQKPTIWTLHDMWPYCSVENYIDIEDYNSKYIKTNSKMDFFSKLIFKKKIKKFKNIKAVICTSQWQEKMCKQSKIFQNAKKILIPLPLDFKLWKPTSKTIAREKLNIEENSKVVYYNLSHIYAKKRKGFDFVINFLNNTKIKNLYFLSTNCKSLKINNPNIIHINFDEIKDIKERIILYSASDVLLSPSRLESFGQTVLEAQACGVPAVTFKDTGSNDIIHHKKTGYACKYLSQDDFNKGVEWSLKYDFNQEMIINLAKERFSFEVIGEQYKNFLNKINY